MLMINNKIIKNAVKIKAFFLDLFFPISCLICNVEGKWLCPECLARVELPNSQYCFNCRQKNSRGEICSNCQPKYYFDGVWAFGSYEDALIAKLVKNLKYRFIKDLSEILGEMLTILMLDLFDKKLLYNNFSQSLIMPVPLHKKRLRWRGFNQSELLAKGIKKYFNLDLRLDELIRTKHKKPQTKLSGRKRKENVKGCFFWKGDWLDGKNIILVDDVITTGSTLNECAKVLKENGAGEVWGLVVARG
ncbi:hypothetical protein COZ73_04995 [Candidatus Falkowbacteria bacterium CG_4_8_14_3_um_filter_36_11]|nr:MAG: hypothetical protein COZ73_04995 [Candidatus Falkowbacteria bacterium CG_4_8_14_3_um_filter_36_11]